MKLRWNDDGSVDAYLRQSWLKEVTMCPERGRHGIVRGDWNITNELTAIGTAVHAGAEACLTNLGYDLGMVRQAAQAKFADIVANEKMRWVRYNEAQSVAQINDMCGVWFDELLPHVDGKVKEAEWEFKYLLDEFKVFCADESGFLTQRDVRVWGSGTCDVVATEEAWDWKTASRKYNVKEKQEKDIQSTMYSAAAVAAGYLEWPVTFKFGVIVRGGRSQVVEVERTAADLEWLRHRARPIVRQTLQLGTAEPWIMSDESFLCNETWCSFWSVCKGAFQ